MIAVRDNELLQLDRAYGALAGNPIESACFQMDEGDYLMAVSEGTDLAGKERITPL